MSVINFNQKRSQKTSEKQREMLPKYSVLVYTDTLGVPQCVEFGESVPQCQYDRMPWSIQKLYKGDS